MTPLDPQATSEQVVRVVAWPCHHGLRLDQALAAATGIPRRRAREMVSSGRVLRNGEAVRVQSRTVEAGDVLEAAASTSPPSL